MSFFVFERTIQMEIRSKYHYFKNNIKNAEVDTDVFVPVSQ